MIDSTSKTAKETQESCLWKNSENNNFYAEIKVDGLMKLATKAGLLNGCDIRTLKPYWINSSNLLDIGSGFGRVVSALLENKFRGNITAIERNDEQYTYIAKKFGHNIRSIHADIRALYYFKERFDTILFLWSGLADFSSQEQPTIVKTIANLLNKNGTLVIDTMPMDLKPLDTEQFGKQSFLTKAENSIVHTYEPSYTEVQSYAKSCGLTILELIRCKTDTNRERWLYVLGY